MFLFSKATLMVSAADLHIKDYDFNFIMKNA